MLSNNDLIPYSFPKIGISANIIPAWPKVRDPGCYCYFGERMVRSAVIARTTAASE